MKDIDTLLREADPAAHHLSQLLGDRQAQARAAELAGGRGVALVETLEDPRLHGLGDADAGVGDLQPQHLGHRTGPQAGAP